jgi:hypothetical protein
VMPGVDAQWSALMEPVEEGGGGEIHCPAWIAGGLDCNQVLEEEVSTTVLQVDSDGDGMVWWWLAMLNSTPV